MVSRNTWFCTSNSALVNSKTQDLQVYLLYTSYTCYIKRHKLPAPEPIVCVGG